MNFITNGVKFEYLDEHKQIQWTCKITAYTTKGYGGP